MGSVAVAFMAPNLNPTEAKPWLRIIFFEYLPSAVYWQRARFSLPQVSTYEQTQLTLPPNRTHQTGKKASVYLGRGRPAIEEKVRRKRLGFAHLQADT